MTNDEGVKMFEASNDSRMYLSADERILWEGRSKRRFALVSNPGVLFAAIFGAVAAILLVVFAAIGSSPSRVGRGSPPTEIVLILPFIFLVIGLSVGIPLILAGRQTGNARYMVTSAAAMIVSESRWTGKRVTVVPLKNVSTVSLTENRDGTGTLVFGQNPFMVNARYSGGWLMDAMPAFWNIERPLEVYQLIRKQMTDQ